ncbi:hypothetical protein BC829DRAFT_114255 [Chytridium lagenaria]|nr:hypothetical protein BC829DRAFT_114255 [Chytridium lagenaria]
MSRKKAKLIDQDIGDRATPTKDMKYSAQKEDESDKKLTPRKLRWGKTDKNHAAEVGEPGSMTKAAKEDAEETTPAPKKEKSKKTEELDRKVKQADRKENPFITKQTSDDEEQNTNEDENEENEKDDGDNMNVDEKPAQESNPSSLLELITQDPEILAEEFQNDDTSTPADSPQKESVDSKASSVADGTLVGEEDDGMEWLKQRCRGSRGRGRCWRKFDEDGEEEVDELSEEKADDEQEEDGEEEEEGEGWRMRLMRLRGITQIRRKMSGVG